MAQDFIAYGKSDKIHLYKILNKRHHIWPIK